MTDKPRCYYRQGPLHGGPCFGCDLRPECIARHNRQAPIKLRLFPDVVEDEDQEDATSLDLHVGLPSAATMLRLKAILRRLGLTSNDQNGVTWKLGTRRLLRIARADLNGVLLRLEVGDAEDKKVWPKILRWAKNTKGKKKLVIRWLPTLGWDALVNVIAYIIEKNRSRPT